MKKYFPHLLFLSLGFLLGWSGWMMPGLRTEYSLDQFFPTEHTLLKGHDAITTKFRLEKESPYLFVIELSPGAWGQRQNLLRMKKLTQAIEEQDNVKKILTLLHIEEATQNKDEMTIGNIFDRAPASIWEEKILSNPLLHPLLITKDLSATLLVIEPREKNQQNLKAFEKEVNVLLKTNFPEATIHSAGVPLLQTRLSQLIHDELALFLIGTGVVFCLVFMLIFSHWTAILCALICLAASNVFTLGLMSAFGISMNALLVTLPVIVSVSVMSLLVHSLHLWSQQYQEGSFESRWKLAFTTLKELFLPNCLGIATTALSFLALAPSSIPLIGQYGLVVALILSFVAVLNQAMMLACLPWVDPSIREWFNRPAKWALSGIQKPVLFLFPMLVLLVGAVFMSPKLNFSARLFDDLPKSDAVRSSTEWIDKSFGGTLSYDILGESKLDGFWKGPDALHRLEKATEELRHFQGVGLAMSVPDFMPEGSLAGPAQIAETFFLFTLAPKNPLAHFLTEDGKSLRIALKLRDIPGMEIEQTKRKILDRLDFIFPEVSFSQGGLSSYAHPINNEVSHALIYDFWQPLVLIGIFLIFMFRSFKWAILSCLPNFLPPAVLITVLASTQVAVKPGIALIFSIALGFAFNNTLYVLSRLRSIALEPNALEKTMLQEGTPCLFESLIMFAGFALFIFSDFTMNQTFGGFMLLSIVAGFAADLFCLPALLKVFPGLYRPQRKTKFKPAAMAAMLVFSLSSISHAGDSAQEILKKSQKLLDAKDDQAKVEMKIIEENGEVKTRTINLQTLRENGFSVMARIESPADIKNMAFLGQVDTEGNEMQWIFLPSSGQVRRLVTGESKAGLLGSEISPEDLNSEAIKSATVKMQKSDDKFHWIEITPEKGKSDYSKVITKISKKDLLPQETQYFVLTKLKKTVAFKNYKKIGPVWRAHSLIVKNHLNKRGTEVLLTDVKVNAGLSSDDFSQSSLKEN
jgi:uncharacterized protein